jgi:hypothetical protein
MHRRGNIEIPDPYNVGVTNDILQIPLYSVLFDSGALTGNYISETLYNTNKDPLLHFTVPFNHSVTLGDSSTVVNFAHIVTVTVSFIDSHKQTHTAVINCSILHMNSDMHMIIGLQTIIFSVFDFFSDLLHSARKIVLDKHT